jgi:hypothetical protein
MLVIACVKNFKGKMLGNGNRKDASEGCRNKFQVW